MSVRLSAQCTDKKVNEVTEKLFKKYKSIDDYCIVKVENFEKDIFQTGFYKSKTRDILKAAKYVKNELNGELPTNIKEMIKIPGVGRKSANVLLSHLFGVVEGVVVDTHVRRFSLRFGLTKNTNPIQIERDLMKIIPRSSWVKFVYMVVDYGREYGNPRGKKELHISDPLIKIYPKAKNYWPS